MEHLIQWLPQHIPAGADQPEHTCITHGDFRMENLMFHPTRPEVVAVLDWELSTLGHPLSDLAYNCLPWHMPAGILRGYGDQDLAAQGLPLERDYIARYCEGTALDPASLVKDWPFYLAFNLFRLSAILQGIGQREREGTSSNDSAREIALMSAPVARWAWAIAQGCELEPTA
jgi:aminoglycoside phosphotransferase (APT) family kinase protein